MSPLQFLVVHLLFAGPRTDRRLRAKLHAAGVAISPSSFSRLMRRMQAAAYVRALHEPSGTAGTGDRPRRFHLTDLGLLVWQRAREFHAGAAGPPPDLVTIATGMADLAHLSPKRRNEVLLGRIRRQFRRTLRRLGE